MAKAKKSYVCSACGHRQNTWAGLCPSCGEGATMEERVEEASRAGRAVRAGGPSATFRSLSDVKAIEGERTGTGIKELDRVLGGGLVVGSYLVLAGEPGAGKTTMASEICLHLALEGKRVGYVSGEESESQARMRFHRLGWDEKTSIEISSEVGVERVCTAIAENDYDLVVIDSIQTMLSEEIPGAPGSVSQVRECGQKLLRAAKTGKTSVLLVGQVTKGGEMAGPRILEHMVDGVLQFEGDRREQLRILRAVKNRFGNTDEIGVFEMTGSGLRGIEDPSEIFAETAAEKLPGSVLTATIEGSRPVLCEIQALVSPSNLPQPVRAVRGLDPKRVQMLLAVLQQKVGVPLGSYDVHINVSGGLKIDDPGTDLAVCLAILSAAENKAPLRTYCAFGEVSLLGIVRPAPQSERRQKEAERLNYIPLVAGDQSLRDVLRSSLAQMAETAAVE